MADLCFTGNIERLETTLGGMRFDAACQGLTARPLPGVKEASDSELKVNRK